MWGGQIQIIIIQDGKTVLATVETLNSYLPLCWWHLEPGFEEQVNRSDSEVLDM